MSQRLRQLEAAVEDLKLLLPVTQGILSELLRASAPPAQLDAIENFVVTARQLEAQGEVESIAHLLAQAEAGIQTLRQWLAVADLAISPYVLRTYVERHPLAPAAHKALLRYFLDKSPHADSDRDKLDYLLTAYCSLVRDTEIQPRFESPAALLEAIGGLFLRPVTAEIGPDVETMLHELQSLLARVGDFRDFDQLVGARMIERARALKINLGEMFYHPKVLTGVVRFNVSFRHHFEQLFRQQVEQVKAQAQAFIEAAHQIFSAIETTFDALAVPAATRVPASVAAAEPETHAEARLGRPLEVAGERPPVDELVRRPPDPGKEAELRGIIKRIERHLASLTPEQAAAGRAVFPLRHTSVELYEWEREAFTKAAESQAPLSARTIQASLGLITWMEEEHTLYEKNRSDRYQWKPHFDLLSYAVERMHDQLHTIHGLLQLGGSAEEAAWVAPLVNTAQRLLRCLEKIAPLFA